MARTHAAPAPDEDQPLFVGYSTCPACGERIQPRYYAQRTVIHLDRVVHYTLQVKRCENPACARYHQPLRPEAELAVALPQQEIGLDVIAEVGHLRYRERLTVGQIHQRLRARGVPISERSVTNLLERYEELVSLKVGEDSRIQTILCQQGQAIVSIDGLQPEKGHEVLWVLREVLSGEVLLARSLLSARVEDLRALLAEVRQALPVPIVGLISDGQQTIRTAAAQALTGVPHQLCQFHYLREAARPITEADRHARKELSKRVRGIRELEREAAAAEGTERTLGEGYCAAVRGALTHTSSDRPPLGAPGLRLYRKLNSIAASLARVEEKKGPSPGR